MPRIPRQVPEELRTAARAAVNDGWTITVRRSGHIAWKSPQGRTVCTSSTSSDSRTTKNELTRLRRAGLNDRDQ